ncbi:hypothetical protein OPKNFCMD_3812 [Methylobacterium crusticola]|uniref:Calcineurin-like phosphoesterase domain-containing protein n=1 Tax=Methylobacterium crusticola TaxID=1697972 RepID=A0ABQ4R082_9HYPH|nr:hypothetical protein [Methylobacterium crusticola]GJD51061.1 hypothetical protein OPKNFCMD_3812 [Methylobacterium crusticola]
MPLKTTPDQAAREIAAIEAALRAGHPGQRLPGGPRKGAHVAAAEVLGVDASSLRARVGWPGQTGRHARDHGLSVDWSLDHVTHAAAARGELGTDPVLPGYAIKRVSTQRDGEGATEREWVTQAKAPGKAAPLPPGHVVKGVSRLLDGEGRTLAEWVKTREGMSPADMVAAIREAFTGFSERAEPAPGPAAVEADLANVLVCPDFHLGLLTWKDEVGANWDLKIAQTTIDAAVARLVDAVPAAGQAVVLGLGDLLHSDGYDPLTARSKNVLDVDGRYPKILKAATRLMIGIVSRALARHERVLVRILPGNHDAESAIAVSLALALYYEGDPRVTVDDDPGYFWWWSHGATLLGATHGDAAKMADLPLIMATRNPEAWGRSKYRQIFTGHVHTKTAVEVSGVTVESFQTPIPADAWHHKQGYGATRSLTAITLDKARGEVARTKVNVL